MKFTIDLTGLHISNEEIRGYFRTKAAAQRVLDSVKDSHSSALTLCQVRHRLAIIGHIEQSFWIITDEHGQPIRATDHLQKDQKMGDKGDE